MKKGKTKRNHALITHKNKELIQFVERSIGGNQTLIQLFLIEALTKIEPVPTK